MRPVTSQRAQGHELPHQSFDVGYSKCEREVEPSGKLVGAPPPRAVSIFEIKPELNVAAAVGPKAKGGRGALVCVLSHCLEIIGSQHFPIIEHLLLITDCPKRHPLLQLRFQRHENESAEPARSDCVKP